MEVVEACSSLLSNREVLEFLKNNNVGKKHTNLATILYETTNYLESSPAATSTLPSLAKFLETIKERKYDLTKIEKIQLANLKPENETDLQLIVDNCEERFTEQQQTEILQLINSTLNQPRDEVQDEVVRKKHKQ